MGITQLAIKRPLTIIMFILAMVILGVVGYTNLQVSRFPKITFPVVAVVVGFPGASAQETEQLVKLNPNEYPQLVQTARHTLITLQQRTLLGSTAGATKSASHVFAQQGYQWRLALTGLMCVFIGLLFRARRRPK